MSTWYIKIGVVDPLTNTHVAISHKEAFVRERTCESVTDGERRALDDLCNEAFEKIVEIAVESLPTVRA